MNLFLPTHVFKSDAHAFLVGGSVRDYLMGRHPKDFDIAVTAAAKDYAATLAHDIRGRLVELGKGRYRLYRIVRNNIMIDVTPTLGNRIESDLKERDFTINALACSLADGRVIDTLGGLDDLKRGIVRMVSDTVFEEDPLRLLRAHRLAICFGLQISSSTRRAITEQAWRIQHAAGERIWGELSMILAQPDCDSQIVEMADTGVLEAIFPELSDLRACNQNQFHDTDVWHHTLQALQAIERLLRHPADHLPPAGRQFAFALPEESKISLKLAILLHDIGKPACRTMDQSGQIHFYGHARLAVDPVREICRRLRMSNHQRNCIEFVVSHHQRPLNLYLAEKGKAFEPSKALGRFFHKCGAQTPLVLMHAIADHLGKTQSGNPKQPDYLAYLHRIMEIFFERTGALHRRPLIDGNELQAKFGLAPSPLIGELLNHIEEARLAGLIDGRKQAIQMAADYLSEKSSQT